MNEKKFKKYHYIVYYVIIVAFLANQIVHRNQSML